MNTQNVFISEVSPEIVLIDPQGRSTSLVGPHVAVEAIRAADEMQAMRGTRRIEDADPEASDDLLILYYTTSQGRPTRDEIARAARKISESRVRETFYVGEKMTKVSGTRSVAYPRLLPMDAEHAVFLVSKTVWYNENRAVSHFPANDEQECAMIDDINDRLDQGQVSLPR